MRGVVIGEGWGEGELVAFLVAFLARRTSHIGGVTGEIDTHLIRKSK